MTEARLIEKLRLIEALLAGAATAGERAAADHARRRVVERLHEMEAEDPPVEHRFRLPDRWSRRVFLALLRRYDLRPYRYPRQRHTTVMVRVSPRFVNETLWPHFNSLDETLRAYLSDITDRVVSSVLSDDLSEAAVVSAPPALPTRAPASSADGPGVVSPPSPAADPPPAGGGEPSEALSDRARGPEPRQKQKQQQQQKKKKKKQRRRRR